MESKDIFDKPYLKSRDLQKRISEELAADPAINSIGIAENLYAWFMELDRPKQVEILSYAISHLRPMIRDKMAGRKRPSSALSKARTKEQAEALVRRHLAKRMMELTYELIDATLSVGPALKAKMQPGQKVKDVWKEAQIIKMLKAVP
jgi:hypothetical protein